MTREPLAFAGTPVALGETAELRLKVAEFYTAEPVTVPTASELFGLKYYGLVYNVLILNLPLGSFLFSGLLAGLLYDAEATAVPGGGNTCVGAHCYRLVFLIMALACVVGFGLDVLLCVRTKRVYAKIHESKRLSRSAVAERVG